ncbi:MAG TPA: MmgE/PrpD family protein [Afifellaceae bacterium]|nr:MmgE/PrpD family protein [Afifellaceae bacterium]
MTIAETCAAETFAHWAAGLNDCDVPPDVGLAMKRTLLDSLGLMVAARGMDYMRSVIASSDGTGPCTAIGHAGSFDPMSAALVNGTAVHGEDFDDTFEGTPVHVGAVIVPSLLASAEQRGLSGSDVLRGMAAGSELVCRLALVAPTAIHRQGFHPTAICGAFGAAAGVATALGLPAERVASALGIVGSMASGIIEYLAEGTWTKRMHPGWAAAAGWRAARMAEGGFLGPRSVFEGEHGAFRAFAVPEIDRDFSHLRDGWGSRWEVANLAFKPYACGTMAQPFIDCALKLRGQIADPGDIKSIVAKVGEGTVHRLWEPTAEKIAPSTSYGAKFSVPYCVAVAMQDGDAGLRQFTEDRIKDPAILTLAAKLSYEIDPDNEYPRNYTGDLLVTLKDGSQFTATQPCLRGGRGAPLDAGELKSKFQANARFGGWSDSRAAQMAAFAETLFEQPNLDRLGEFAE